MSATAVVPSVGADAGGSRRDVRVLMLNPSFSAMATLAEPP